MAHGGNFWDIWIENSYPFELLVYYLHIIARKMETVNSIFSNYRILETERELIRFGLGKYHSSCFGAKSDYLQQNLSRPWRVEEEQGLWKGYLISSRNRIQF
jgi:hypothetical protein